MGVCGDPVMRGLRRARVAAGAAVCAALGIAAQAGDVRPATVAAGMAASAALGAAESAAPVPLRFSAPVGRTLRYHEVARSQYRYALPNAAAEGRDGTQDMQVWLTLTPEGDGRSVRVVVERVAVNATEFGSAFLVIDTASMAKHPREADCRRVLAARPVVRLRPDGLIESVSGLDGLGDLARDPMLGRFASAEGVRESLQPYFRPSEARAEAPAGDSWAEPPVKQDVDPLGEVTISTKATLRPGAGDVVTLALTGDKCVPGAPAKGFGEVRVDGFAFKESIEWDAGRGMLRGTDSQSMLKLRGSGPVVVTYEATSTLTVRLLGS